MLTTNLIGFTGLYLITIGREECSGLRNIFYYFNLFTYSGDRYLLRNRWRVITLGVIFFHFTHEGTYFRTALALLAATNLMELAARAETLPAPKGKVSASLLELVKSVVTTRGLTATASVGADLPLQAANAIQVYNGYVVVQALATTPSAKQLLADLQAKGLRQGMAYGRWCRACSWWIRYQRWRVCRRCSSSGPSTSRP